MDYAAFVAAPPSPRLSWLDWLAVDAIGDKSLEAFLCSEEFAVCIPGSI
jgi:hypothetical protein